MDPGLPRGAFRFRAQFSDFQNILLIAYFDFWCPNWDLAAKNTIRDLNSAFRGALSVPSSCAVRKGWALSHKGMCAGAGDYQDASKCAVEVPNSTLGRQIAVRTPEIEISNQQNI